MSTKTQSVCFYFNWIPNEYWPWKIKGQGHIMRFRFPRQNSSTFPHSWGITISKNKRIKVLLISRFDHFNDILGRRRWDRWALAEGFTLDCSPWGGCWSNCWSQSFSSRSRHSRARSCPWWWRTFAPRKTMKAAVSRCCGPERNRRLQMFSVQNRLVGDLVCESGSSDALQKPCSSTPAW